MATLKIFATFVVVSFALVEASPFFRRDYHFNANYDSFYKFHLDPVNMTWENALETCSDEGAKIFYPKTNEEWKVIIPLVENIANSNSTQYILVGMHNEFDEEELVTVDGLPTPIPLFSGQGVMETGNCVYMSIYTGSFKMLPCENQPHIRGFVCKREIQPPKCKTIDEDYYYVDSKQKCFKVNNNKRTWHEAEYTCFLEGGHLIIPERNDQFNGLNLESKTYFAGFRRSDVDSKFYSVKGETFKGSNQQKYNSYYGNNYGLGQFLCGTIEKDNQGLTMIKTSNCNHLHSFICEIEVKH